MTTINWIVRQVCWDSPEGESARRIRWTVFVEEQGFPGEQEFDEVDQRAYHVVAFHPEGKACGTGRLATELFDTTKGRIGRVAVLAEARGQGCGKAIVGALLSEAWRRGFQRVVLSAQQHALEFYRRLGFTPCGAHFLDAGVPHQEMEQFLGQELWPGEQRNVVASGKVLDPWETKWSPDRGDDK